MKRDLLISPGLYISLIAVAVAQSGPAPVRAPANGGQSAPVSYASVSQLNGLLSQLEATSQTTQVDLAKLRIEKWKMSGSDKKQALQYVESVQRNLQGALPEIIGQLRNAPEDVSASFKLYRNLDALYDVLNTILEGAQSVAPKDESQALATDLNGFEESRKQLAERIENLSASKEQELNRLHTEVRTLQAQVEAAPPKKVVVDDSEPAKKPSTPKKRTTKKPAADSTKPSAATAPSNSQQPGKPQ
jgi:chromosome segregation ATPase